MKFRYFFVSSLFYLLTSSYYAMPMSECTKLSSQADSYSEKRNYARALEIAQKVADSCKPAPYNAVILAGKILLRQEDSPKEALKYFNQAMKQGPDFYMGYLNASAAYMELGDLDKSIKFAKVAVEKAKKDSNKLKGKYNLALAYYKKAAPDNNKELYKKGYDIFKQTSGLKIFKGSSFYFMGLYEETINHDEEKAKTSYTAACKHRHKQSCVSLEGLSIRLQPYTRMKNYKPADDYNSLSLSELINEMKKCYKAKYNMQESAVDSTVKSITGSMNSLPEAQRKKMYIQTLNSIGCKA